MGAPLEPGLCGQYGQAGRLPLPCRTAGKELHSSNASLTVTYPAPAAPRKVQELPATQRAARTACSCPSHQHMGRQVRPLLRCRSALLPAADRRWSTGTLPERRPGQPPRGSLGSGSPGAEEWPQRPQPPAFAVHLCSSGPTAAPSCFCSAAFTLFHSGGGECRV